MVCLADLCASVNVEVHSKPQRKASKTTHNKIVSPSQSTGSCFDKLKLCLLSWIERIRTPLNCSIVFIWIDFIVFPALGFKNRNSFPTKGFRERASKERLGEREQLAPIIAGISACSTAHGKSIKHGSLQPHLQSHHPQLLGSRASASQRGRQALILPSCPKLPLKNWWVRQNFAGAMPNLSRDG